MIQYDIDARGVATIAINRPDVANAINEETIAALTEAFEKAAADSAVRVVVLTGRGKAFSAGADLAWMKRASTMSHEENVADALNLAALLQAIDTCPKPTVALVNGAAFGGAVGLTAACDVAIAADNAAFRLSEVRLGLVPGIISPYVVAAIGAKQARRLSVTASLFDAHEALRIGLVASVVPLDELGAAGAKLVAAILENAPQAMTMAKTLIGVVANEPIDEALAQLTAEFIAAARASDEGREGVAAFLEKRLPNWRTPRAGAKENN
ncbi:enoyl-CoA hydratase-related protein [Roseiterribacter gracilis]|uniref:Methylglutaconyl-CoA hydratase n=1 Tax=Roseiterribacter gracilis TaxID=2812848 RepID=A0A8S8XCS3_9PROT|nr:methylglutaconyl-CoA hydratase [Rhodospirillales bacterium TMPK1]